MGFYFKFSFPFSSIHLILRLLNIFLFLLYNIMLYNMLNNNSSVLYETIRSSVTTRNKGKYSFVDYFLVHVLLNTLINNKNRRDGKLFYFILLLVFRAWCNVNSTCILIDSFFFTNTFANVYI